MSTERSTLGCFFLAPEKKEVQEEKKEDAKKEETKEKEIKEELQEDKVEVKKEKKITSHGSEISLYDSEKEEIKKPIEPAKIKKPEPIKIEKPIISKISENKGKINERYSYEVSPFRLRMIEYGI